MQRSVAQSAWLTVAVVISTTTPQIGVASEPLRRFEVRDSIEIAQFTEPVAMSPDGRLFATVTQRGVLPEGVIKATIWQFDASSVRQVLNDRRTPAVKPVELARSSASINGDGGDGFGKVVMRLTWEPDGSGLLFLARDGRENRQLFRVNLVDRKVTALTPSTQDVVDYTVTGNNIVYFAGPDVSTQGLWWSNPPTTQDIVVGTGQSLLDLLYPESRLHYRFMPTEFEIWRIRGSMPAEPVRDANTGQPMRVLGSYYLGALGLSHDGAHLVAVVHADRIPSLWERYQVPGGLDSVPFHKDGALSDKSEVPLAQRESDFTRARQYQVFDLEKGTLRPLIAAPIADFLRGGDDQLEAVWSPDDQLVAVTGTFLPLKDPPRPKESTGVCGVAVVGVEHGDTNCLILHGNLGVTAISHVAWETGRNLLLVQSAGSPDAEYERSGARWKSTGRHPRTSGDLELTVRQGLDDPPVLFAKDVRSAKEQPLFDPNPQLRQIELGTVAIYRWKGPHDETVRGGLAKPPDFKLGHRYPLVIQTHGFPSDQFFTTGYGSNTAAAGRALAARDMLVLQVAEPHDDSDGTWREPTQRGTDVYLAAIDQLARDGLVDPQKVGITGYSRRGPYVVKSLEDAPSRFAAAAVVNSEPGSIFGYYTFVDDGFPGKAKDWAIFNAGTLPYGDGLQTWVERAAGMRTDKIRAPVLISAGDPWHLIALWSLYAPLHDQGKAVELQYIRSGHHNFAKPLQILAHQEMLVDWFDFWLNGREASGADKTLQYTRWREMKAALARPGAQ